MARRLALATAESRSIADLVADATERLETAQKEYAGLVDQVRVFQESIAKVNAEGVELEKRILGIQGELKALTTVQGNA